MPDAERLRQLAARMFAAALATTDQNLIEWLCMRAGEYLDQAGTLEITQLLIANAEKKE